MEGGEVGTRGAWSLGRAPLGIPIVEQLVLEHLVVGHGLSELVDSLQEKLSRLCHCFQLQFVHDTTDIVHCSAVIEILRRRAEKEGTMNRCVRW